MPKTNFLKKHWKAIAIIWGILAVINIATDIIAEKNKVHYIPERFNVEGLPEPCFSANHYYLNAKWERDNNYAPSRRKYYDYYKGLKQQKERVCDNKK
jgi:hypothetical protein